MHITYPEKKPRIIANDSREEIFCMIRKKWVVLTPEEWVRQNFLLLLTDTLQFPKACIAVEKKFKLGEVTKRFDIVVYDADMKPLVLVECKEMNIPLNENVFGQVLRYQSTMQAQWLIITNGNEARVFRYASEKLEEYDKLPVP